MATTPTSHNSVQAPPTPLHGPKFDTYQPYSTRRITRRTNLSTPRATRTPSPTPASSSPPPSAAGSTMPLSLDDMPPRAKRNQNSQRRVNDHGLRGNAGGALSSFSGAKIANSFSDSDNATATGSQPPNLGLPTPAKTPRKKIAGTHSAISSAARVLFPVHQSTIEDAMPNPRKQGRKNRKHVGFSLDSSTEEDNSEDKIQIFTDSKEKIPELDSAEDNPFYGSSARTDSSKDRESSGSKDHKPRVTSNQSIKEAFDHERGMVYVLYVITQLTSTYPQRNVTYHLHSSRGKKFYRKFPQESPEPPAILGSEDLESDNLTPSARTLPLTRSSIKPRLLFPPSNQSQEPCLDDEEAPTDVEDLSDIHNNAETTPKNAPEQDKRPATPVPKSSDPTTPPTTGHATRAVTRRARLDTSQSSPNGSELMDESSSSLLLDQPKRRKVTPFDGWQRTKAGLSGTGKSSRKRGADILEEGIGSGGEGEDGTEYHKKIRKSGRV
ncbi:MAG: hypothetical protein Q9190_001593 [Brigantiaea leucoxantha]